MGTITWKKSNGNELDTNDRKATIKHMESIGAELLTRTGDVPDQDVSDNTDAVDGIAETVDALVAEEVAKTGEAIDPLSTLQKLLNLIRAKSNQQ